MYLKKFPNCFIKMFHMCSTNVHYVLSKRKNCVCVVGGGSNKTDKETKGTTKNQKFILRHIHHFQTVLQ